MTDPQIAAIICTHNRDAYLGQAINSLLEQATSVGYEIIVVDNASTDATRELVHAYLPHPRLRYLYEPTVGLSVARNTGAEATDAPILAYLDDDAVASPRWLDVLHQAYQTYEKLAIAGGKVTLIWPPNITQPRWISSNLAGNLGAYDLGDRLQLITTPGLTPRGLNYSVRRSFLEKIGGFDTHLGRVGTRLLSNEELHMTERAIATGWQVAYLPDAQVAHHVAPERVQPSWFLRRSWWQGISECYRERCAGRDGLPQFQRGGERLLRGLYRAVREMGDRAQCFDHLVYAYGQLGYLSSALQGLWSKSEAQSPGKVS
ncbi:MAG: glycosyltransferase [Synechococcales bacterium]|nr:glycosyltransferase [Synechococcales bacterium]